MDLNLKFSYPQIYTSPLRNLNSQDLIMHRNYSAPVEIKLFLCAFSLAILSMYFNVAQLFQIFLAMSCCNQRLTASQLTDSIATQTFDFELQSLKCYIDTQVGMPNTPNDVDRL